MAAHALWRSTVANLEHERAALSSLCTTHEHEESRRAVALAALRERHERELAALLAEQRASRQREKASVREAEGRCSHLEVAANATAMVALLELPASSHEGTRTGAGG